VGIWRIVKELKYPLHKSLRDLSVSEYPHSINYVIKRRMQIDSYNELPEDKRPPRCLSTDTEVFILINGSIKRVKMVELVDVWEDCLILTPTGWRRILNLCLENLEGTTFNVGKVTNITCSDDHQFPVSHSKQHQNIHIIKFRDLNFKNKVRDYGRNDYILYQTIDKFVGGNLKIDGFSLDYDLGFLVGAYTAEGGIDNGTNRVHFTIGRHEGGFRDTIISKLSRYGLNIQLGLGLVIDLLGLFLRN